MVFLHVSGDIAQTAEGGYLSADGRREVCYKLMLFNSVAFAIFFSIIFLLYWAIPWKYRWTILLIASYYFYLSWDIKYIGVICFTTIISYVAALGMEQVKNNRVRKVLCGVTVVFVLSILIIFKYANFFSSILAQILKAISLPIHEMTLHLMLPVGISFYIFQTVGYLIDVYRGKIKAERHLGLYAVFVSFFPRLIAGPIERAGKFLPQLRKKRVFSYDEGTYGLKLMAVGFFKKLVIADNISGYVDMVFGQVNQYTGFALVTASLLFTVQIYCDFSGYSDIAIGVSKLLRIDLGPNFRSPYFSFSIKEFWSRWHISLSTWFRDYLYIPLGGNRVGPIRHNLNLLFTFLISGLWHGANWTFVFWGGLHGIYQVIENIFCPWKKNSILKGRAGENLWNRLGWSAWWLINVLMTFLLVSFAWIFFKAESFGDAFYMISHLTEGLLHEPVEYIYDGYALFGADWKEVLYIGIPLLLLIVYEWYSRKEDGMLRLKKHPVWVRWLVYLILVLTILLFSMKGGGATFVYAQF